MHSGWTEHLTARGARLDPDRRIGFGAPPAETARAAIEGSVVVPLTDRAVVDVVGDDAQRFLHNQLTADVAALPADRGVVAGYCTPKGRLLAILWVTRIEGGFRFRLPHALVEPTTTQLLKYRLRSRCEITDVSDQVVAAGVSGPTAPELVDRAFGTAPATELELGRSGELQVLRIPGPHPRFEVTGPPGAIRSGYDALVADGSVEAGSRAWELLDVRAGIPELTVETSEAFVPQMVNLHSVGGISFTKGCFPGQEVVARLRYLGELKRRTYRARVDAPDPIAPATAVRSADGAPGSPGQVLRAAPDPDGGQELLAVIQVAAAEGALRLGEEGPALELLPLPYDVATALEKG